MDADLMQALYEAWERVRPKLENDPNELAARLARRRMALLQRPHRAWCLAVRANDTRMTSWHFPMVPDHPITRDDAGQFHYREHEVTLEKRTLCWLCRPVRIPAPGVEATEAAKMLGVTRHAIMAAAKRGIFSVHYHRGLGGKHGPPVPIVYTSRLLDPAGMPLGAMPEIEWGTHWRYLSDHIPDGLSQTLTRVPIIGLCPAHTRRRSGPSQNPPPPDYVWYKWKNGVFTDPHAKPRRPRSPSSLRRSVASSLPHPVFTGWRWICPGCKQHVKRIFYPLPPLFQADFVARGNVDSPDSMPSPPPCFACKRCHNIEYQGFVTSDGWGTLIAWASGGLLYGREVERPAWFKLRRKRPYFPRQSHPDRIAPRCLPLLLDTSLSYSEIARKLNVPPGSVAGAAARLYRQHNVHGRDELRQAIAQALDEQESE